MKGDWRFRWLSDEALLEGYARWEKSLIAGLDPEMEEYVGEKLRDFNFELRRRGLA